MKSVIEKLSPTRVKLSIEVSFDELSPHIDGAYKTLSEKINPIVGPKTRYAGQDIDMFRYQDDFDPQGFNYFNPEKQKGYIEAETWGSALGKGFDSFCPLGPVIATGLNHRNLNISTRLNGELRQSSNTADLVFDVVHLVSYISQAITLRPGDVIITGTPQGIGPMLPGDVVEVEISGVGCLSNPVRNRG